MIHKLAAPASRSLRPLIEMNTFESAFTNEGAIANCLRRGPVVLSMLLIGSSIALAQLAPVPSTPGRQRTVTVPVQPQSSPVADKTSSDASAAKPGYLTSVRGLQGMLAETDDGAPIAAQSIDAKFNPASSIKLATTLAALKSFGP